MTKIGFHDCEINMLNNEGLIAYGPKVFWVSDTESMVVATSLGVFYQIKMEECPLRALGAYDTMVKRVLAGLWLKKMIIWPRDIDELLIAKTRSTVDTLVIKVSKQKNKRFETLSESLTQSV